MLCEWLSEYLCYFAAFETENGSFEEKPKSFFMRMKCTLVRRGGAYTKSSGFKVRILFKIISEQCITFSDLCDLDFCWWFPLTFVLEVLVHKAVGTHLLGKTSTKWTWKQATSTWEFFCTFQCQKKFECLVNEMLFIKEHNPLLKCFSHTGVMFLNFVLSHLYSAQFRTSLSPVCLVNNASNIRTLSCCIFVLFLRTVLRLGSHDIANLLHSTEPVSNMYMHVHKKIQNSIIMLP